MTQSPIAAAVRLLRENAEELKQSHTLAGLAEWPACEDEVKAAYDEQIAVAAELETVLSQTPVQEAQPVTVDVPASGAVALGEYLKDCDQHSIVADVGGAFAFAFAAGFKLSASQAARGAVAEQALLKVLHAVQHYLPPDGVSARATLTTIIEVVDPWPLNQAPSAVTVHDERAIPVLAAPAAVAVPAKLPTGDEIRAIARSVSTSSSDSPSSSEYVMAGYRAALAATPAAAEWCLHCGATASSVCQSKCANRACPQGLPSAAAPVVLPGPDAAISEVMELVKDWAQRDLIAGEAGIDALSEESSEKQHQEAKRLDCEANTAYRAIESKLRALLAQAATAAAPAHPAEGVQAEPLLWVSPGQAKELNDRAAGDGGNYLPCRKTRDGLFTMPLYTAPADELATATGLPAQAVERSIFIDMKQAAALLELFGGEPTEFTVVQCPDGHSGQGLYAYGTEYPEDGASFLGKTDADATPAPQAQADAREDSALLDAMERQRIALHPEYEGPWDAAIYSDEGEPIHAGTGSTPREAIRAAIAASKE